MSSTKAPYGDPNTRRLILRATWELLEERGGSIRVVDAAARAGVSRQAVYLHFGDRTGLLVALVEYIDEVLGSDERIARIFDAPTGAVALQRMVEALSTFNAMIDSVARVLEAGHYQDDALSAAWRNRLAGRHAICRMIIQRIADEGQLADRWTVDAAAGLLYMVTLPGSWRELTRGLGWTTDRYADSITALLHRSLLSATSADNER